MSWDEESAEIQARLDATRGLTIGTSIFAGPSDSTPLMCVYDDGRIEVDGREFASASVLASRLAALETLAEAAIAVDDAATQRRDAQTWDVNDESTMRLTPEWVAAYEVEQEARAAFAAALASLRGTEDPKEQQ